MKRIMITAHAAMAMAATYARDEEIAIDTSEPKEEPYFDRYDLYETKPYNERGAYKIHCKRADRDPTRAKVKAARKQRRRQ